MASQTRRAMNRQTRRDDAVGAGIKVTIDGVDYTVHIGEVSSALRRAFREQVGVPFSALFSRNAPLDPVDIAAAVEWLARLIDGEALTYDQVADKYALDKDFDVEHVTPDADNQPVRDKATRGRVIDGEVDRPEA